MKERKETVVALRDAVKYLKQQSVLGEQAAILSRLIDALADLDHGAVAPVLTPVKPWQAGKTVASDPVRLRVACAALVKAKIDGERKTAGQACGEVATLVAKLGLNGASEGEQPLKEEIEGWEARFEYDDGPGLENGSEESKQMWKNFCGLIRREPGLAISQLERLIEDYSPRKFL
jgi:hypothetical protein